MLEIERKEMYKQLVQINLETLNSEYHSIAKSAELSSKARLEGNLLYQQKNHDSKIHEQIWKKYSDSIALAPNESNELALGYGNRSALLFHLQKYEDSIKDIDRAISISDSNCLKLKLICRKVKCHVHLNLSGEEELQIIEDLMTKMDEKKGEKKTMHDIVNKTISYRNESKFKESNEEKETKTFTLKNTVNDFSSVAVKYHDQKGKYLIANRDLEPGEVIFVETPYAAVQDKNKAYAFCAHCFEQCWSLIPCQRCHLCMFCSEECRLEAWEKYHDIECNLYTAFQIDSALFDPYPKLGVRTLIQGVKEAGSITKLKAQLRSLNNGNPLNSYMKDGSVQSLRFISVYNLRINYILPLLVSGLPECCARIVLVLAKHTNFFGKQYTCLDTANFSKNSNFIFVSSLLLKISKISMVLCRKLTNRHILYKGISDDEFPDIINFCIRGSYINPIGALINHSCNPNVDRSCIAGNKIAFYALTPIKKNSELLETSSAPFYELSQAIRTLHFSCSNLHPCSCIACENNWPALMETCEEHKNVSSQDFLHRLYKGKIEREIYKFTEEAIRLSGYEESLYREELIENLAKGIKKCMKSLPEPSMLTCELISALRKIFNRLYGIKFTIPVKCIEV